MMGVRTMLKKDSRPLSHRAIMRMPYDQRIRHYTEEKGELFERIASMSASEVAQAHRDLADKWGI